MAEPDILVSIYGLDLVYYTHFRKPKNILDGE